VLNEKVYQRGLLMSVKDKIMKKVKW